MAIKLDKQDVKLIKQLCDTSLLFDREIAEMFGVSRGHITKIKNKKRWNYDYGEENKQNRKEATERFIKEFRTYFYGESKGTM